MPYDTTSLNTSQEAEARPVKRGPLKRSFLVVSVLIGATIAWQLSAQSEAPGGDIARVIPTTPAELGTLERVLRVSGVTSSIDAVSLVAPRMQRRSFGLTLLELVESGAFVKAGEVVARIDSEQIEQQIENLATNMANGEATLARRLAEQQVTLSNIRQDLMMAEADVESWTLESNAAEVLPDVEQEITRLALEEAEISYQARLAESKLEEEIEAIDIRRQELSNQEYVRDLDRYTGDLERHTLRAPIGGMAVRQEVFRNGAMAQLQVGDQLHPGLPFLKIMDMSNMQVEARANQVESQMLRVGQEARIGLDAFPELQFGGRVIGVGALAQSSSTSSSYVRTIPLYVRIDGTDPKLLPDLSAHVDIILEREENVLQVPLQAVFEEAGQRYVYVREGQGYDKRAVTIGNSNFTHAAVTSGLTAGEEVALERPPEG